MPPTLSVLSFAPTRPGLSEPDQNDDGRAVPAAGAGLAELVHHRDQVEAHALLDNVQRLFQNNPGDYRAIVDGTRVVGLCSRATIGFMLGSRYGFALYGSTAVITARSPRPLIYPSDTPLACVLDEALSRTGSEFFEDIIVVDGQGALVGLVPVPSLAKMQLQLYGEQLQRAVSQDRELRQQNLELFQINQQLRQSQGRYKALFENTALGVVLLDNQGEIVAHNRRFEELLRLTESAPPPTFQLEQWLNPADRAAWRSLLRALEQGAGRSAPRITELKFELPEGSRLFELHTSWVVETGQICVFLDDITEAHSLEQRMARQEKQSMLDTLVAGVAHELNNKLTPVMGFAELLHAVAPQELQKHTRCIQQSTQEAAQIIRQLLNLSRPSGGSFTQFDSRAVCREAVEMLRFQLREGKCEAVLQLPAHPACVRGDPAQIKQVLINLVLNAIHAMEGKPEPRLTISVVADAVSVRMSVCDIGTGIRPEIQGRIFDPFFTTKGPRGTGLGLSISASIVQQHGGELSVKSTPGQGSTFTISLPASTPQAVPPAFSTPPMLPNTPKKSSRHRVLVVDDEEFVRQFMQEALRVGFGCSVETAVDGCDAVAKLDQHSFDLILSDIRMPRMDGLQLMSWITTHRPELAQRVVFVTGHAGTAELDQAMGTLGCPVLRKPFTIDAILTVCRPYLEKSPAAGEPEN